MGYSYSSISRILDQKPLFEGKRVVTLGTLYPFLEKREIALLLDRGVQSHIPKELFSKHLFVELLGAEVCHSLDISDYQQSEIICNLNLPLPSELINQYDVIIDAGTLEHLSNLSIAIENLFKLLSKDGIYYFTVPCNNWVNHGFYQFSPTFFVDLCLSNPSLELSGLSILTSEKSYKYDEINSLFRNALLTSRMKLGVSGVIKRIGEEINLDLIQSKYRQQYITQKPNSYIETNKYEWVKKIAFKAAWEASSSIFIPLSIKELVFNRLYKLKQSDS